MSAGVPGGASPRASSVSDIRFSPNLRAAEIRLERGGDGDGSIGVLVSLHQRDEEPRERGAGAVQRMAVLVFALAVLEAQAHAARLEVAEVRAARHLQVRALPRRPD